MRDLLACLIVAVTLCLPVPAIAQAATEGEALIKLAEERRARGEYALALEAGSEALRLARATGNRQLAADAHNILGLIENSRDQSRPPRCVTGSRSCGSTKSWATAMACHRASTMSVTATAASVSTSRLSSITAARSR